MQKLEWSIWCTYTRYIKRYVKLLGFIRILSSNELLVVGADYGSGV